MRWSDKIQITNEDNMELMARYPDNYFDLAIVDPPYGHNALDGSRTKNKYGINRGENWDCYRPDKRYFNELIRVSKNQIIWGGNYFISDLIDTKCFIIWDKKIAEGMNNYAMCEMAWTSFNNRPAKIYRKIASGDNRIHPTQKPVALYKWLLDKYAKQGDKILDTHLGSGSIAIACHDYGFELTACELDTEYYEAAKKRFLNHSAQTKLFL